MELVRVVTASVSLLPPLGARSRAPEAAWRTSGSQAEGPWPFPLTSLWLHFLLFKMGTIITNCLE